MKLHKKRISGLLMVLLSLSFLLTACTKVEVEIGIDAGNTAYLSYHIELDIDGFDQLQQNSFTNALHQIAYQYQQNFDFAVNIQFDVKPYTMTAVKRVENNSFEEAFQTLQSMLTNEDITIFMQVDMAYQTTPRQVGYIFDATVDAPHVLRTSNIAELPPGMLLQLEEGFQESTGLIRLMLPADESVSSSHEISLIDSRAVMDVPLDFSDKTTFEFSAKLDLFDSSDSTDSINTLIEQQLQFRTIAVMLCFAAAFILLIALIVIIVTITRRKSGIKD